jgi:hypothetical protein
MVVVPLKGASALSHCAMAGEKVFSGPKVFGWELSSKQPFNSKWGIFLSIPLNMPGICVVF